MIKKLVLLSFCFSLTACLGRTVSYDASQGSSHPKFQPNKTRASSYSQKIPQEYYEFIKKHNPSLSPFLIDKIALNINRYSQTNDLDPKYVLALMARESSFRTDVVSPSGAIGLGQLMRGTASDMGITNPYDPVQNIIGTTRFLSQLKKKWNGSMELALASYKIGPYGVEKIINAGHSLPTSTQNYIRDIKRYYQQI